jgi:hypothetical protein
MGELTEEQFINDILPLLPFSANFNSRSGVSIQQNRDLLFPFDYDSHKNDPSQVTYPDAN